MTLNRITKLAFKLVRFTQYGGSFQYILNIFVSWNTTTYCVKRTSVNVVTRLSKKAKHVYPKKGSDFIFKKLYRVSYHQRVQNVVEIAFKVQRRIEILATFQLFKSASLGLSFKVDLTTKTSKQVWQICRHTKIRKTTSQLNGMREWQSGPAKAQWTIR